MKPASPPPDAHWWLVTWFYFRLRMGEIWQNSIAINCLALSFVITTVMGLFEFPVTLNEALGEAHRPNTFCHGSLDFMLAQAAILQVVYLVVGGFYFTVIMKRTPLTYFGLAFPVMVAVVVAICVPLLFNVPTIPAAVLVSFSTVIPYYLNCYVFYCLYSSVKQEHYGFTQGLYGYVSQYCTLHRGCWTLSLLTRWSISSLAFSRLSTLFTLRFGTNVVGLLPYVTVAVNLNQLITMIMCFILMGCAVVHSMVFACRHRHVLAHIETPHEVEQREKEQIERSRNSKSATARTKLTGSLDPVASADSALDPSSDDDIVRLLSGSAADSNS